MVQRWATVVGDSVKIEAIQLCHSAAAVSVRGCQSQDPVSARFSLVRFLTGEAHKGDREIEADAPLDRIPLFVRAGSILPLVPEIEYADEKPAGPIELRMGADGAFALYQGIGDSYDYEKGAYSLIPLHWSQANRTLTIGDREGQYPGLPSSFQMNIAWVSNEHGAGPAPIAIPDKTIEYTGKAISVQAR